MIPHPGKMDEKEKAYDHLVLINGLVKDLLVRVVGGGMDRIAVAVGARMARKLVLEVTNWTAVL